MSALVFRAPCPSCGAEVPFRSAISAMAVCEYCHSTVLRDADAARELGKIGRVLEDYSPIQIGTSGVFGKRAFTVVGRIQLRYDAGLWNEWFITFEDGSGGWLGDASGQYMITLDVGPVPAAPAFETIRPELRIEHAGRAFVVTDVRSACCVGGQGELPFVVGDGYEARVADARLGNRFMTFDYSDGAARAYAGTAVKLAELDCQLLRSNDAILASCGTLRGANNVLDCPNCGSPLQYKSGVATMLVCPACHSEVDCSGNRAEVLAKHGEMARYHASLDVGDRATIDGDQWWSVIGLIELVEVGDDDEGWTEYLLYHASKGFRWVVETTQGWFEAEVLDVIPERWNDGTAVLEGTTYYARYPRYQARVTYAAGAFNWRVKVGDVVTLLEYEANGVQLAGELTASELTWSRSKRLTSTLVAQWFGKPLDRVPERLVQSDATATGDLSGVMWTARIALALFNLPVLLVNGLFPGLFWLAVAWWLLGLPLGSAGDDE
ncbi:DUF4178 domain-containing protein [Chitinibacteraceae bacterium HSL-7]